MYILENFKFCYFRMKDNLQITSHSKFLFLKYKEIFRSWFWKNYVNDNSLLRYQTFRKIVVQRMSSQRSHLIYQYRKESRTTLRKTMTNSMTRTISMLLPMQPMTTTRMNPMQISKTSSAIKLTMMKATRLISTISRITRRQLAHRTYMSSQSINEK